MSVSFESRRCSGFEKMSRNYLYIFHKPDTGVLAVDEGVVDDDQG